MANSLGRLYINDMYAMMEAAPLINIHEREEAKDRKFLQMVIRALYYIQLTSKGGERRSMVLVTTP